jgi:hypothetical protein
MRDIDSVSEFKVFGYLPKAQTPEVKIQTRNYSGCSVSHPLEGVSIYKPYSTFFAVIPLYRAALVVLEASLDQVCARAALRTT